MRRLCIKGIQNLLMRLDKRCQPTGLSRKLDGLARLSCLLLRDSYLKAYILRVIIAIPGRHLNYWKKKTYFLCFRKYKSNKINGITFLETHKQGDFELSC
jgi:hypothetical protein